MSQKLPSSSSEPFGVAAAFLPPAPFAEGVAGAVFEAAGGAGLGDGAAGFAAADAVGVLGADFDFFSSSGARRALHAFSGARVGVVGWGLATAASFA
jgi:hypothetical protein